MKKLRLLILSSLLFLLFTGADTHACRPYLLGIQNDLAVKALERAYLVRRKSVLDIQTIQVTDTQMFWVDTDSGINCPDQYVVTFQMKYKDGSDLETKVSKFKGEYTVEFKLE